MRCLVSSEKFKEGIRIKNVFLLQIRGCCRFYKQENDNKEHRFWGVCIPLLAVREVGSKTSEVSCELLKASLVPSAVVCCKLHFIAPVLFCRVLGLEQVAETKILFQLFITEKSRLIPGLARPLLLIPERTNLIYG